MMAIGSFNGRHHQAPMADMNVVPLVDVMLVLLVIFIVTAPLLTHSVKIDLPGARSHPHVSRVERIELAIRSDHAMFWNGERITAAELDAKFSAVARLQPGSELHIRADKSARYEIVAEAMSAAARAGVTRIAFATDPASSGR